MQACVCMWCMSETSPSHPGKATENARQPHREVEALGSDRPWCGTILTVLVRRTSCTILLHGRYRSSVGLSSFDGHERWMQVTPEEGMISPASTRMRSTGLKEVMLDIATRRYPEAAPDFLADPRWGHPGCGIHPSWRRALVASRISVARSSSPSENLD